MTEIKGRESLKALFRGDSIPTDIDFECLIESVLNRRDDKFFGQWSTGVAYKPDDIVIYNKTFYTFLSPEQAKTINADCDCSDDCCDGKSPDNCCRWQKLNLCAGDDDCVKENENTPAYVDSDGDLRANGIFINPVAEYEKAERGGRMRNALKMLGDLEAHWRKEETGFTAENINDVLPIAFKKFADDTEGIGYHHIVVLLVKAVQELSDEIEHLKKARK